MGVWLFFLEIYRFFNFIAALLLNVGHSCGFASCGKWGRVRKAKQIEKKNLVVVSYALW